MGRRDYFDDPGAPAPTVIAPAVSAIVRDQEGRILLHQRRDNELWYLPGGRVEIGESVAEAVVREVREKTRVRVETQSVVGVYSDPRAVVAYDDGEVRQQFSVCVSCWPLDGEPGPTDKASAAGYFSPEEIADLACSRATRLRVDDFLDGASGLVR